MEFGVRGLEFVSCVSDSILLFYITIFYLEILNMVGCDTMERLCGWFECHEFLEMLLSKSYKYRNKI